MKMTDVAGAQMVRSEILRRAIREVCVARVCGTLHNRVKSRILLRSTPGGSAWTHLRPFSLTVVDFWEYRILTWEAHQSNSGPVTAVNKMLLNDLFLKEPHDPKAYEFRILGAPAVVEISLTLDNFSEPLNT